MKIFLIFALCIQLKSTLQTNEITDGIENYWLVVNNNTIDVVSGANLYNVQTLVSTVEFIEDRLNNSFSAFLLNNGYYQAPAGSYFDADFTITAWVKVVKIESWSRILDFGNGPANDNVVLALSNGMSGIPTFQIYNSDQGSDFLMSPTPLKLNTWTYIAITFGNKTATMYIDSVQVSSKNLNMQPKNITRNLNYIGRSNWDNDAYAQAAMSEIKIFNKVLNSTEIANYQ